MIRPYRGHVAQVAASAFVDPSAQVIGEVAIGDRSSIWPCVVIRGDVGLIRIGDETNIQDNSTLHSDEGFPLTIGNRVTVGHQVMLHGCTIEDDVLVGIGAVVLNGARVGRGSVIAACALVPEGMEVPPGSVVMGVPGKVRREVTADEKERFDLNLQHYIEKARTYREATANAGATDNK
jgi:carbonic anhydrase/acetyltransferase-like protein (isoleucine patch superfamily)